MLYLFVMLAGYSLLSFLSLKKFKVNAYWYYMFYKNNRLLLFLFDKEYFCTYHKIFES